MPVVVRNGAVLITGGGKAAVMDDPCDCCGDGEPEYTDCEIDCGTGTCPVIVRIPHQITMQVSDIDVNANGKCSECTTLNGTYLLTVDPLPVSCSSGGWAWYCSPASPDISPPECAEVTTSGCGISPPEIYMGMNYQILLVEDGASDCFIRHVVGFDIRSGVSLGSIILQWHAEATIDESSEGPSACDGSEVIDLAAYMNAQSPISLSVTGGASQICEIPDPISVAVSA